MEWQRRGKQTRKGDEPLHGGSSICPVNNRCSRSSARPVSTKNKRGRTVPSTVSNKGENKMRFEEKKDHYLDTKTGIKWSKQNFGSMLWEDAITKLPENWRLPTIEELLSIIDYSKHDPATELSDMVPSSYWSSTTYAYNTGYAWGVNFNDGHDDNYYKSNSYYVRAVLERRK